MIGKHCHSRRVGYISMLICGFYPNFILYPNFLLSENIYIFLLVLTVLILIKSLNDGSLKYFIVAGVVLGFTCLSRSIALLLTPVLCGWLILYSSDIKTGIKRSLTVLCCVMVVILPWTYRNYQIHDRFVLIDTSNGVTFFLGNNPHALGDGSMSSEDPLNEFKSKNEIDRQLLGFKRGFEFIGERPFEFLKLGLKKEISLWGFEKSYLSELHEEGHFGHSNILFISILVIVNLYFAVLVCTAIAGFAFSEHTPGKLLILFAILYFCAMHFIVFGKPRYNLPMIPFLTIWSSYFFCHFMEIARKISFRNIRGAGKTVFCSFIILMVIAGWICEINMRSGFISDLLSKILE